MKLIMHTGAVWVIAGAAQPTLSQIKLINVVFLSIAFRVTIRHHKRGTGNYPIGTNHV